MQVAHRLRKAIWLPFVAAGFVWFVSLASFCKLVAKLNYSIPFEMETRKWWVNGLGTAYIEGLRVYEPGQKEAYVAGDFLVRYKPWEIWFGDRFGVKITGRNISSEYLKQLFIQDSAVQSNFIEKLKVELMVDSDDGSLVIKKAEANGSLGEGTAAGSLDSNGVIDMQTRWVVNPSMKRFLPNNTASLANPTVVQCFFQGNVEHPSVRLVSDYFQVELG